MVENMAPATLPDGSVLDLFGSGGGLKTAHRLGVPLLGSIPLSSALREAGDDGVPLVVSDPNNLAALIFATISQKILTSGATRVRKRLPFSKA